MLATVINTTLKVSSDIRVFIVEDDATQAEILNDKLLEYNPGYTILKFKSSTEFLDYFSNGYPKSKHNYVILDYFLQSSDEEGSLNGLEVIKKMQTINSKVKIILYSAYENDDQNKFSDIVNEEKNVIEYIKKTTHSYANVQNVMRFDFAKSTLNGKKKRFQITLAVFALLLAISGLHFIISYF